MQFSRKKQEAARAKAKPKSVLRRQILVGIGLTILIALLITAVWYGTRVQSLTVERVAVVGGETISHAEIERLVQGELSGTYYRLIPKRFAWTYPEARITERIADLPRVKHVRVKRTSGQELSVVFDEYVPSALWCESLDSDQCFFMDQTGYAFARAPELMGASFVRYIDTSIDWKEKQKVFESELIDRTERFMEAAHDDLGLNIIAVEKTSTMDLAYHIAGGGVVRTSLMESFEDTIENLATILQSEQFNHLQPGNFQYIDLRFGNKVYVNEELPSVEVSTSTASSTLDE